MKSRVSLARAGAASSAIVAADAADWLARVLRSTPGRLALFAVGLLVLYAIWNVAGASGRSKYPPNYFADHGLRLAACMSAAFLIVTALTPTRREERPFFGIGGRWLFALATGTSILLALGTAMIAGIAPGLFSRWFSEDSIGEHAQETLLVISAIIGFATMARAPAGHGRVGPFGPRVALFGLAAVALTVFLEEISWGQKYMHWRTPDFLLGANSQQETNFHNLDTWTFEISYYSAAAIAFMLVPFAWPRTGSSLSRQAGFYVPPAWFAVFAAPLCTYLYEMWNIVPLQTLFFASIFTMVILAWRAARESAGLALSVAVVCVLVPATEYVVQLNGAAFTRKHDMTEVRELQIAVAYFVYMVWVAMTFRQARQEAEASSAPQ